MKKFYLLLVVLLTVTACSSDDSSDAVSTVNYFPLETSNKWTYQNETESLNENNETTENLSVSSVSRQGNQNIYQLDSDLTIGAPTFTSTMASGQIKKNDGQLIFNGTISIDLNALAGMEFNIDPITIDINNAPLYDSGADAGQNLFSISDQITQDIAFQGGTIPFTIEYTLETFQEDFFMSYTANGRDYDDVISSSLRLTVEATANVFVSIVIADEQEVLRSTNYFAADTGLIYSSTNYSISTNAVDEFGIPSMDANIDITQGLESFNFDTQEGS